MSLFEVLCYGTIVVVVIVLLEQILVKFLKEFVDKLFK